LDNKRVKQLEERNYMRLNLSRSRIEKFVFDDVLHSFGGRQKGFNIFFFICCEVNALSGDGFRLSEEGYVEQKGS